MKILTALLVLAALITAWLMQQNSGLRDAFDKANAASHEQKTRAERLELQLHAAAAIAAQNEEAQVLLRQKLEAAAARDARREQRLKRLLNENEDFRRWYGTDLPDVVRRVHQRPACVSAADCLQQLPESESVPDAGQRSAH